MQLYAYTSVLANAVKNPSNVLADIRRVAKVRNPSLGVTGVLFFHQDRFLQVLEGDEDSLESLMASIERDPRHRNLVYLLQEPISYRSFPQWNMDTFDLSALENYTEEGLEAIRDAFVANVKPNGPAFVAVVKQFLASPHLASVMNS